MSKMRFGICYSTSDNGDHHQNQAQRLFGLGDVDIAGNLYLRTDTYYSRGNKQQDQNKNQDSHRSDMPKLREQVEGVTSKRQGGMSMKKFNKSLILPVIYPIISVILLSIYSLKALDMDLALMEIFIISVSAIMLISGIAAAVLAFVFTKKFNRSFILPVTYSAIAVLLFIYSLNEFDFYDLAFFTYIFVYLSLLIFAAGIEAFILIAVFDLNLKRNFFIYIISLIASIILVLICWYFCRDLGNYVLVLCLPIVLLTAHFVVFMLRKTPKLEFIVWFLLDPFLFIFITQITVLLLIIFD